MIPDAEIAHLSQRRLRIRIPARRGDFAYFQALGEQFKECGGMEGMEINPRTASILFVHETGSQHVLEFAASRGIFHVPAESSSRKTHPSLYDGVTGTFDSVDDKIKEFTKGELDLSSLSFVALVGAGIYQIAKGNFSAPAWYTAFWYGLNIFLKSKPEGTGAE